jgi:hypothetical protein
MYVNLGRPYGYLKLLGENNAYYVLDYPVLSRPTHSGNCGCELCGTILLRPDDASNVVHLQDIYQFNILGSGADL